MGRYERSSRKSRRKFSSKIQSSSLATRSTAFEAFGQEGFFIECIIHHQIRIKFIKTYNIYIIGSCVNLPIQISSSITLFGPAAYRDTVHWINPLGFDCGAYTSTSFPVFFKPLCQLMSGELLVQYRIFSPSGLTNFKVMFVRQGVIDCFHHRHSG